MIRQFDNGWKLFVQVNLSVCYSNILLKEKKNEFIIIKFLLLDEHRNIFEQDLSQLVEQLKQFVFLDIYGQISERKLQSYYSMIQSRFPNSQFDIQISRFRLWI